MQTELKNALNEIAQLTWEKCKLDCRTPKPTCCSAMYCDMAIDNAKEYGIELKKPDGNDLLIGPNGCLAEPWLRPLCSLHFCERSLRDINFSDKYFTLREKIEELSFNEK